MYIQNIGSVVMGGEKAFASSRSYLALKEAFNMRGNSPDKTPF